MLNVKTMNLDLIRTFVVVGQSKNYYEASIKLNLDYSNVFRHIKALETMYKTKLVTKDSSNNILLTRSGKELFEGFEKAYNLLFITEKGFIQNKDNDSCKISIGMSSDISEHLVDKYIDEFKKTHPKIAFKITSLPTKDLYASLANYSLDFVIEEKIELKKSSEITFYDIYKEEYCLIYKKDKYNINELKDIDSLPLILPVSTKKERNLFSEVLKENNITLNLALETYNYKSIIKYVKKDYGIGLVPKYLTKDEKDLGILDLNITKQISISYINEFLSPTSASFLNEIKNK